ncbi:MAG: NAD(+) diphosphatase, partial [Acidimicrobiaceae bacterium]|nr:NAD(+) diphosphatase [Acidimicrobiaceae bacterium]
LDRFGERRKDASFLEAARADPGARLLLVGEARVPVDGSGRLAWRPLTERDGSVAETLVFLGVDERDRPLFSRDAAEDEVGEDFAALREVGPALPPEDAAAALQALGLSAWHRRSPYCAACGGETRVEDAGHRRRCLHCGTGHFPRTDPAVIMLVTDGDRCVLGRRVGAPQSRWSTLAGFVEAGESLEAALAREVYEEVGLTVTRTHYRGSQPWPFPASLMVAFEAEAPFAPLSLNYEHQDVRWFFRDDVADAIATGEMAVPPPISAGGFLIRSWLARRGAPGVDEA